MKYKIVIIILIVILGIIQLISIDTENPEVIPGNDYFTISKPPQEIVDILRKSCFDCHSFETKYPWYAKVAPVSWILNNHIQKGREHLNFSNWNKYSSVKQNSLKENCSEEIQKNQMPLKSYTFIHPGSKLTTNTRKSLEDWFNLTPDIK